MYDQERNMATMHGRSALHLVVYVTKINFINILQPVHLNVFLHGNFLQRNFGNYITLPCRLQFVLFNIIQFYSSTSVISYKKHRKNK